MDPQRDDNIAVPTVVKTCTKLVIDIDEPPFADDRLDAGQRVVERGVLCPAGNAAPIEPRQPLLTLHETLELAAQALQARGCGDEAIARLPSVDAV